jgi:hypothetical protein
MDAQPHDENSRFCLGGINHYGVRPQYLVVDTAFGCYIEARSHLSHDGTRLFRVQQVTGHHVRQRSASNGFGDYIPDGVLPRSLAI